MAKKFTLTKSPRGLITYRYLTSGDCVFVFNTLAEVGAPYQQWFRDEIKARGWIVDHGRDLAHKPRVADYVTRIITPDPIL